MSLQARYAAYLPYSLICLAAAAAYASVWPNSFVYDDVYLIVRNTFLQDWRHAPDIFTHLNFGGAGAKGQGFYRPLPMLLHLLLYQLFGASTVAFHVLNLGLQALNGCLLYAFGERLGFRKEASLAAALLWVVHPLHSEAVAYMSSTPELLWAAFCLLGLMSLLPESGPRGMLRVTIFFVLALGCKESAIVFPALALVVMYYAAGGNLKRQAWFSTWPLWAAAAIYLVLWMSFVHLSGYNMSGATLVNGAEDPRYPAYATSLPNRFFTSLATLPAYLGLVFWPQGLHMDRLFDVYTTPFALLPMLGFGMVAISLFVIYTRKGLAAGFGLLWFAVSFSPSSGILFPINGLVAEHWLYLPLMGLTLGVTQTLAPLFSRQKRLATLMVLAGSIALGAATFLQTQKWKNPETLYHAIVDNGGNPYRISEHLALYEMAHNEFDKALPALQYLTTHTFARSPQWLTGMHMLAVNAWLEARMDEKGTVTPGELDRAIAAADPARLDEALHEAGQALLLTPDFYWAHWYLVRIYHHTGDEAMARFHEKALQALSPP